MALTGFEQALQAAAAATEASLQNVLPEIANDRLRAAMRYAVMGKGKRLRPFFVFETCKLFAIETSFTLATATALECVHCYSLAHDDLPAMDNDDVRRGLPTLHRKFDEATAILAADALLTLAFEILGNANVPANLISALAKAAGSAGMVGGQMLDIEAETQNFTSVNHISRMQMMKTGALFEFACRSGPLLAQEDEMPLQLYAKNIGLAFQIADDVLDVEATPEMLGKATQKDKRKGKATFVDLLGLEGAKAEAQRMCEASIAALDIYGERAEVLRQAAQFMVKRSK